MRELGRYLQIAARGWWIVVPCFLITTALTAWLVADEPPVYESTATFVVRPRPLGSEEVSNALDALVRGEQITATYAEIARSHAIESRVESRLQRSMGSANVTVDADVVPGTQLLTIVAHGPDPEIVERFAAGTALETQRFVQELQDTYELVQVDPARVPTIPVGPNRVLTAVLGAVFGLLLGFALAAMWDSLARSRSERPRRSARPKAATAVQSEPLDDRRAIAVRARQELSRAKLAGSPVSFGLLRASPREAANGHGGHRNGDPPEGSLLELMDVLRPAVRRQDVLYRADATTIGVMLPGVPLQRAEHLLSDWLAIIATASNGGPDRNGPPASLWTGACEYRGDRFVGNVETERQTRALLEPPPSEDESSRGPSLVAVHDVSSAEGPDTAGSGATREEPVGDESWAAGPRKRARKGLSRGRRGT